MTNIRTMKNISLFLCYVKIRWRAGIVALMLLMLAGCTAGTNVAPQGEAVDLQAQSGPGAGPPAAQTKGFVLEEKTDLGASDRRDFERAVDFLGNDDFDKAIELLEKVVASSPGVTAPYVDLAIAYRKIDKPDEAEKQLQAALTLFPKHPVASNEYGLLLRAAGRFSEAKSVYEATIEQYPEYLPARKNLAILCDLYLNDPATALAQFEQYSEIDPDDEQVKLWISELRLRQKK